MFLLAFQPSKPGALPVARGNFIDRGHRRRKTDKFIHQQDSLLYNYYAVTTRHRTDNKIRLIIRSTDQSVIKSVKQTRTRGNRLLQKRRVAQLLR